jgi:hypothetical protein
LDIVLHPPFVHKIDGRRAIASRQRAFPCAPTCSFQDDNILRPPSLARTVLEILAPRLEKWAFETRDFMTA